MKDKIKLLGLVALAAVIVFSMTACPSPAGGGSGDPGGGPARVAEKVTYESEDSVGGVYVLVITQNTTGRAAYSAQPGDTDEGLSISSDGVLISYTGSGRDVKIPHRVTRIGSAYYNEEIGDLIGAFYGCTSLTSVTIPEQRYQHWG